MGVIYLSALAERIRAQVSAEHLPDEDEISLFHGYAVLLLAKGDAVTAPDVHNAWVAWMLSRQPAHEALAPYEDLPSDVAAMDQPFVDAIHSVARALDSDHHE